MNIYDKLDKEIEKQCRNGRLDVYILKEDLEEITGKKFAVKDGERIYVGKEWLMQKIREYKNELGEER
jgi:hypothetical protein